MEPTQSPEFPTEPGPTVVPPPDTPKPKLSPPEQPGWLPRESDEGAAAADVETEPDEQDWHPHGFPGVEA